MQKPPHTARRNNRTLPALLTLTIILMMTPACGSDANPDGPVIIFEDVGIHDTDQTDTDQTDTDQTDTDQTDTDQTDTPEPDNTPGPISLSILNASETHLFNGEAPANDSRFALLEINLKNGVHNEPIPAFYELFSLHTEGGLNIAPSPKSSSATPACSEQITLTADSNYTCTLLFEIPNAVFPTALNYTTADGRKASADVILFPETPAYPQIAINQYYACALKTDQTIECWGDDIIGIIPKTPTGKFTQISLADGYACGLRDNAEIACWGQHLDGRLSPPTGTFTQLALGALHACAIHTNGKIACWGNNDEGQIDGAPDNPNETFTQVVSTIDSSCALKSDNTVHCWGNAASTQNVPTAKFRQITAGLGFYCGVQTNAKIACWGIEPDQNFPDETFTQVSAYYFNACAIKMSNRHLSCIGTSTNDGQLDVPDIAVDQVALSKSNTCFIRSSDKKFACIGKNEFNILDVPDL